MGANISGTAYYTLVPGPFEIPVRERNSTSMRCRETLKEWANNELALARPWGIGHRKLLCPNGNGTAPKTLKAHEALKMIQLGIFSVLASVERDDGYGRNMLKGLMGELTVIIRELTTEIVDPKVGRTHGMP